MRMPKSRQSLVVIACCGVAVLFAIIVATASGALTVPEAAELALTATALGGILVLGVWIRRLSGKVRRLDAKVRRLAETPTDTLERRLGERLDGIEAVISRLSDTAGRLEERTATVLATLGEDRVEAAYLTREHYALLTAMAADLRAAREQTRPTADRP